MRVLLMRHSTDIVEASTSHNERVYASALLQHRREVGGRGLAEVGHLGPAIVVLLLLGLFDGSAHPLFGAKVC